MIPPPTPSPLADDAVAALQELLRGFEAADHASGGALLREALASPDQDVCRGLVTSLLRIVFMRLAEPSSGVTDLFERLEADAAEDADAMMHRFGAWAALVERFRALHEAGRQGLFDPDAFLFLEGRASGGALVPDAAVHRFLARICRRSLDVEALGSFHEALLGFGVPPGGALRLQPTEARRRSGSHYTPRALTEPIVRATLAPLLEALGSAPRPEQILGLKVCDPAMGSGAFLIEACEQLADALASAWLTHGAPTMPPGEAAVVSARRLVAENCLYGVDKDPLAVELARLSLWLFVGAKGHPRSFVDHALKAGDALVGTSRQQMASFHWAPSAGLAGERPIDLERAKQIDDLRLLGDCLLACFFGHADDRARGRALTTWRASIEAWLAGRAPREPIAAFVAATLREGPHRISSFHWEIEFLPVFGSPSDRGFAAVLGNPPWVSYAGRAAQPIPDPRRRYYLEIYKSFAGYRNLQGLFVERALQLLRPGGRLGFVLPSSMAELDGYGPTRAAHDRFAACDPELPDLGEASFPGVFQPSMVLRSTVRPRRLPAGSEARWPIARPDLDDAALELLKRLEGPPLPAELFGERGLQTSGEDTEHLRAVADAVHTVPLRVGSDIQAFRRGVASAHADAAWFGARLRDGAEWKKVSVLLRQTARVPIAVLSDGLGFRNSLLAGFATEAYPAAFLVAYLNSAPVRWHHYYRHRDARLGMPQVKIGHLRAIPAPPGHVIPVLAGIGERLSARNNGITGEQRRQLDDLVGDAFGLSADQQARIRRDAEAWP